jgi:hypothetical protein
LTALAQGCGGLALVMSFALLRTRQIRSAAGLLAVQAVVSAISAVSLHQPLMALPPLLLAACVWLAPGRIAMLEPGTAPIGGAKIGILAGAVLAALCQSQGAIGLPLAVILLSALLAVTRRHSLMHVIALMAMQNGLGLAACLIMLDADLSPTLLPLACFVLPLPLAVAVMIPPMTRRRKPAAKWLCWIDLAVSLSVLAATVVIPLDAVASIFAPLLGLDGVLRSCRRRKRGAIAPLERGLALLASLLLVLTVAIPDPFTAWLAMAGAISMSLLSTLRRRWDEAVLAFVGAGIALLGQQLLLAPGPAVFGYFSLFAGFAMIACVVPDLGVVLVVLILRLANLTPWPQAAEALGVGIALIGVMGCATMLTVVQGKPDAPQSPRSRLALLELGQASIAMLSICLGQEDGRFAGLVLLMLLILTRTAARMADGIVAGVATACLGGVPPLGVFPGLVLVVLALSNHAPWLLLPLAVGFASLLSASLPRHFPGRALDHWPKVAIPSIGWLPLALALFIGYFAPDSVVRWSRILLATH